MSTALAAVEDAAAVYADARAALESAVVEAVVTVGESMTATARAAGMSRAWVHNVTREASDRCRDQ